jgi:hypothetical protein
LIRHIAFIALSVFPLVSCDGGDASQEIGGNQFAAENLQSAILRLQNSYALSPCEEIYRQEQLLVAKDLDRKLNQIRIFQIQNEKKLNKYRFIPLGPLWIREPIKINGKEDDWLSESISWHDIITEWRVIKNQPIDERWVKLNSVVRGILVDDHKRIVFKADYQIDRARLHFLGRIYDEIYRCLLSHDCLRPEFSIEENQTIESIPRYLDFRTLVENNHKSESMLSWAQRIYKDTTPYENRTHDVHKLPSKLNDGILEVSLDAGDFRGSETTLARYIESAWKTSGFAVKIKWVFEQPDEEKVYRFVADNNFGGRAYTNRWDRTIHIVDGDRSETLAHEFGHALGLSDEYYTSWNPMTCKYKVEYNKNNLMSGEGKPTRAQFDFLQNVYQ